MKFTLFHAAPPKRLAVIVGLLCSILGLGSLIAAWRNPDSVASPKAAGTMSPESALCLLLASASLLLVVIGRGRRTSGFARSLSAAGALIAGVALVDRVAGTSIGPLEPSVRMAPNAALAFFLLAGALFCLPSRRSSLSYASQGLAAAATVSALFAAIGHLYRTPPLFALGSLGRMSVPAVVGVMLVALGVFAARVEVGLPALVTSRGPGGLLARRLLLPTLLAPIAIGWLVLEGARRGLHPTSTAMDLIVTAVVVLQLTIGLVLAGRLEHLSSGQARLLDDSRRAREALQSTEERLRLALQCGAIGVWQYDARTDLVSASPRCQEMFGFTPQGDQRAEVYRERVHPEDRPRFDKASQRSLDPASEGGFDLEYRVVVEHEGERWFRSTGQTFFDATGQPERMFGTVSDITDHKLASQNAEAASRAKDAFLAVLGHELRNPLSPILTALELMKLRGDAAFSHERSVIERQVHHMVRLVDDLLDVSRIARGKIDLKRRQVEIASVIERSIELTSPLFEQRRHTLRVAVPAHGLVVYGDEQRLVQVVSNLLINAGKYTQQGGTIDVSARASGRRTKISIRDNGIGIPDYLLSRLFDHFAQGPRVIERSQGGLGLGLSIAKSLVELHGGTITAESAGLGRGSEFTVTLPLELGPEQVEPMYEAPRAAGMAGDPAGHAHRVLVVDDNPDTAETLAEILRFDEHEVSVAYDGPGALALAREQHFDLAFLDIGLPVMDGYELARRIRDLQGGNQLVLVAVTGYGRDADRRRSEAAGFDGHLVKPVEPVQVLAIASEPAQASLGL